MELGCSVEVPSFGGLRPLHHACNKNLERVVRALIKGGADVNSKDENGDTPLHYAASRGVLNIVVALIEGGAKTHVVNGILPSFISDFALFIIVCFACFAFFSFFHIQCTCFFFYH